MSQNFGASVSYMWDGLDRVTDVVATIRMQFIDPDFVNPNLTEDLKGKLFEAVQPELQQLLDARFGPGAIYAKNADVRVGSIEIWVQLATIGGAVYAFFKDYEDLRKGLLLFVEDIRANSLRLFGIVYKTYGTNATRVRRARVTNRGTISH